MVRSIHTTHCGQGDLMGKCYHAVKHFYIPFFLPRKAIHICDMIICCKHTVEPYAGYQIFCFLKYLIPFSKMTEFLFLLVLFLKCNFCMRIIMLIILKIWCFQPKNILVLQIPFYYHLHHWIYRKWNLLFRI